MWAVAHPFLVYGSCALLAIKSARTDSTRKCKPATKPSHTAVCVMEVPLSYRCRLASRKWQVHLGEFRDATMEFLAPDPSTAPLLLPFIHVVPRYLSLSRISNIISIILFSL